MFSALPPIVLQKSQNALRLICRKKTKQVTIADQCALKRTTRRFDLHVIRRERRELLAAWKELSGFM